MSSVMITFWSFKQLHEDIARMSWLLEIPTAVSFLGPRNQWLDQAWGTRRPPTLHREPTRPRAPLAPGEVAVPRAFQGTVENYIRYQKVKLSRQMNNGMVFNNPSVSIKNSKMI